MNKIANPSKYLFTLAICLTLNVAGGRLAHAANDTDAVTGAAYKHYRLNECLQATKSNPLTIKRFLIENDVADKSLTAVKAEKSPTVYAFSTGKLSSSPNITPVGTTDIIVSRENAGAGFDVNYTLYDAGANKASVAAAKANIEEVEATHRKLILDLLNQTSTAFYTVLYYQRIGDSDRDKISALQENLRAARGRYDIGTVTKTDLLNAESALSLANAVSEENAENLYASRVRLAALIGVDPAKTLPVADEPADPAGLRETIKQLSDSLLKNHPEIARGVALLNGAIAERDLVKSQSKLNVALRSSLGVGMTYNKWDIGDGASDPYIAAVVRVELPLYDGGKNKAALQKQEDNIKLQDLLNRDVENQLEAKVMEAYSAYKSAEEKIKPSRDAVTADEEAYRLAKGRYSAAIGTQKEALDALHQLTLDRLALAENIYNRDLDIMNLRQLCCVDPISLDAGKP
jgi:outer membrane protein